MTQFIMQRRGSEKGTAFWRQDKFFYTSFSCVFLDPKSVKFTGKISALQLVHCFQVTLGFMSSTGIHCRLLSFSANF
jgi:hypothetical protein